MESELMPCVVPDCESPMRRSMQGDTVYCSTCSYSSTPARHNALARRSEIGALVERIVETLTLRDTIRLSLSGLDDEVLVEMMRGEFCGQDSEGALLESLRALAAELEVSGE